MKTDTLRRVVVTPLALFFAGIGASFWITPQPAAQRFGLAAADASGLVALRADLGGLFAGLALLCLGGAWLKRFRTWLAGAAVVLLAIATGRAIGWIAGGRYAHTVRRTTTVSPSRYEARPSWSARGGDNCRSLQRHDPRPSDD